MSWTWTKRRAQPPLGGCVLKPTGQIRWCRGWDPAAFRRLCVETPITVSAYRIWQPAAFRRLCVETDLRIGYGVGDWPAAFRRLCVETSKTLSAKHVSACQPPLGGCVLKPAPCRRRGLRPVQPPLGGCVLKRQRAACRLAFYSPAAFRRLCVETRLGRGTAQDQAASRL